MKRLMGGLVLGGCFVTACHAAPIAIAQAGASWLALLSLLIPGLVCFAMLEIWHIVGEKLLRAWWIPLPARKEIDSNFFIVGCLISLATSSIAALLLWRVGVYERLVQLPFVPSIEVALQLLIWVPLAGMGLALAVGYGLKRQRLPQIPALHHAVIAPPARLEEKVSRGRASINMILVLFGGIGIFFKHLTPTAEIVAHYTGWGLFILALCLELIHTIQRYYLKPQVNDEALRTLADEIASSVGRHSWEIRLGVGTLDRSYARVSSDLMGNMRVSQKAKESLSNEELAALLHHEFAHLRHRHLMKGAGPRTTFWRTFTFWSPMVQLLVVICFAAAILAVLHHVAFPICFVFILAWLVISMRNQVNDRAADQATVLSMGDARPLASALIKCAVYSSQPCLPNEDIKLSYPWLDRRLKDIAAYAEQQGLPLDESPLTLDWVRRVQVTHKPVAPYLRSLGLDESPTE